MDKSKELAILYSIWLNEHCTQFVDAYKHYNNDRFFYIDSEEDMNDLFELFQDSINYKNFKDNV